MGTRRGIAAAWIATAALVSSARGASADCGPNPVTHELTIHVDAADTWAAPEFAGWAVAGIGDVNGDGHDDVAYGTPNADTAGFYSGSVTVVSGADGSVIRTIAFAPSEGLGHSLSGISDQNGDGVPDIVASANRANSNRGRVYVLSGATGGILRTITNANQGEQFGWWVDNAGDVDADGREDIVVSAPYVSSFAGRVLVYSGATGAVLRTWAGPASGANLGWSVSGAGDVNGDGHADILATQVAGPVMARVFSGADGSELNTFAGSSWGVADDLGDVDGDGYGDYAVVAGTVKVVSGHTGTVLHDLGNVGALRVSSAGDVNGDGLQDVIVGRFNDGPGGSKGRVLVYSSCDGSLLYSIAGPGFPTSADDRFGHGIDAAGDVNGDGYADFVVGAPYHNALAGWTGVYTSRVLLAVQAPESIVAECDESEFGDGHGASVALLFDVIGTPPSGSTLVVDDTTNARTLLSESATAGPHGVTAVFPMGTSSVSVRVVSSGGGVLASDTVSVQVSDTLAPSFASCEDHTVELAGPMTPIWPVSLGLEVSDACDPNPVVTLSHAALALGTTEVTATARDATGNVSTCVFDVTVVDTTAPAFAVAPEDLERECASLDGTVVAFDVLATDLSGPVSVVCVDDTGRTVDPAGTLFTDGLHLVTCTALDGSGNEATWTFEVEIVDTTTPALVCPDDPSVANDEGMDGAAVEFEAVATDLCDPDVDVTYETPWGPVSSGDFFPVGTTPVVAHATDDDGNAVECTFHVTVRDVEAPRILGPSSVTLTTDCCGSSLALTPSALGVTVVDNSDPSPVVVLSTLTAGPGTTDVVVTATDADGNVSEATVEVTVLAGAFTSLVHQPLSGSVDNVIRAGQTVPLKVRLVCDNVAETGAVGTVESVEWISGSGTPIAHEVVEDSGASNDDEDQMRLAGGFYLYNLSTQDWPSTGGARFRVTLRFTKAGHVDTLCTVILVNR